MSHSLASAATCSCGWKTSKSADTAAYSTGQHVARAKKKDAALGTNLLDLANRALGVNLTPASATLLTDLAKDAGNWSGVVPTDGNVTITKEERGNLTQLKRAHLVRTFNYDGQSWVEFSKAGSDYVKVFAMVDIASYIAF